jgi:hypothetical protein
VDVTVSGCQSTDSRGDKDGEPHMDFFLEDFQSGDRILIFAILPCVPPEQTSESKDRWQADDSSGILNFIAADPIGRDC